MTICDIVKSGICPLCKNEFLNFHKSPTYECLNHKYKLLFRTSRHIGLNPLFITMTWDNNLFIFSIQLDQEPILILKVLNKKDFSYKNLTVSDISNIQDDVELLLLFD